MNRKNSKRNAVLALFLACLFSLNSLNAAGPMGLPEKYKSILNKKWTLTKIIYKGKDATEMYFKNKLKGEIPYYIFKNDGSAESNEPNVKESSWKYEKGFFDLKMVNTDGSQGTVHYTIGKVNGKTLQLDLKPIGMSSIYTAK